MTLDIKNSIKNAQSYDELLEVCSGIDALTLTTSITRKISRALKKHDGSSAEASKANSIRIAYLGNVTFEPLPEYVSVASCCHGINCESYIGAYDQAVQELMNPGSGLNRFSADMVFIHFTLQELAAEVVHHFSGLNERGVQRSRNKILDAVTQAVELVLSRHNASVLLSNFPAPAYYQSGIADQKQDASERAFYMELNLELLSRFKNEMRVQVLDMEQLTSLYGKQDAFDQKLYYLAKVPWQEGFYPLLADQIVRHLEVEKGWCKKCLVLDLDNTLWGGVLGEAGVHGIKVGHGDGESEAFYDFQSKILALKNRGILLAICSKNNPEDVEEVFSVRTDMPLELTDFSMREISWDMKHEAIKRIAIKLNIGLESLVFIDDNPAECELIQQMLPEVTTVLLPPDPSSYPALLDRLHGFDKLVISDEDGVKTRQYENNAKRSEHQASFEDLQSYLESLQTSITISVACEQDQLRVHQLFTKTNQFNLTTKRYTLADIEVMTNQPDDDLYVVKASDRFGDLGTIGLFLLKRSNCEEVSIDSFVLSCRAMGRGIETAIMNFIKKEYFECRGNQSMKALFVPTQKNTPARSFYVDQGFTLLEEKLNGESQYVLSIDDVAEKTCTWINIK